MKMDVQVMKLRFDAENTFNNNITFLMHELID